MTLLSGIGTNCEALFVKFVKTARCDVLATLRISLRS